MNPKQREAAERLADRLLHSLTNDMGCAVETAALLRELLAEPQGELVAWMSTYPGIPLFVTHAAHEHPQSTVVRESYTIPLYIHPPQQRKPLTDEQIKAIWWQCESKTRDSDPRHEWWSQFARAIERSHGITGDPT